MQYEPNKLIKNWLQISRSCATQCEECARQREEEGPCTVELADQEDAEQVLMWPRRRKRREGRGEAKGAPGHGRQLQGRICEGFSLHYKQADGGRSGVSVGAS